MTLRAPAFELVLALAVTGALVAARAASADVVSLIAVADNTLYESASGALSNGAGTGMFAGRTVQFTDNLRRAVMRFDLAGSIPAGSVINSVQLQLLVNQGPGGATAFDLHPLLASWGQGASVAGGGQGGGAPSAPNDATWRHRFFPGTLWTSAGGDFGPTSTSQSVSLNGFYAWPSSPAFVADAQNYLANPASNFGWILIGDEVNEGSARRFATRESAIQDERPTLLVNYTPPGVPAEPATWGGVKSLYR